MTLITNYMEQLKKCDDILKKCDDILNFDSQFHHENLW